MRKNIIDFLLESNHEPMSPIISVIDDDPAFIQNVKRLEEGLVKGSKVIAYRCFKKNREESPDGQSCWLDVLYTHGGYFYRTRQSHKNNQYLKIRRFS